MTLYFTIIPRIRVICAFIAIIGVKLSVNPCKMELSEINVLFRSQFQDHDKVCLPNKRHTSVKKVSLLPSGGGVGGEQPHGKATLPLSFKD